MRGFHDSEENCSDFMHSFIMLFGEKNFPYGKVKKRTKSLIERILIFYRRDRDARFLLPAEKEIRRLNGILSLRRHTHNEEKCSATFHVVTFCWAYYHASHNCSYGLKFQFNKSDKTVGLSKASVKMRLNFEVNYATEHIAPI